MQEYVTGVRGTTFTGTEVLDTYDGIYRDKQTHFVDIIYYI